MSATTPSRARSLSMLGLKVLVAAGLIGWLVRSGSLDFAALGVFLDQPQLLAFDLGLYVSSIALTTLRWKALLSLAGVHRPVSALLPLQMTAFFFNVAIPGNVGGDVLKALQVARAEEPGKRPAILLIVFVERLCGLTGLLTLGALVTLTRAGAIWADPLLGPLAKTEWLLALGALLGPVVFVGLVRRYDRLLGRWTGGSSVLGRLVGQLVEATRLLSGGPRALLAALGLSMLAHAVAMAFFLVLARQLSGQAVSAGTVASTFPLGLLTVVLPISPAGLGVGHVAFDRLFAAVGLSGGATIFNVYIIGQLVPCLLGVVPYLSLKNKGLLATEAGAP